LPVKKLKISKYLAKILGKILWLTFLAHPTGRAKNIDKQVGSQITDTGYWWNGGCRLWKWWQQRQCNRTMRRAVLDDSGYGTLPVDPADGVGVVDVWLGELGWTPAVYRCSDVLFDTDDYTEHDQHWRTVLMTEPVHGVVVMTAPSYHTSRDSRRH